MSGRFGRLALVALTLGLGLACGPDSNLDDGAASSGEGSTAATPSAATEDPVGDDTSTSGNGTGTGIEPPSTYEEDGGGTGCTFTCPDPPSPPTPPGPGSGGFECDLEEQDCPEGEKCMPWANDGGNEWNATRCTPLADNPQDAGEQCNVEGSGTSGIDNCDIDALCWQVDPATNIGTCYSLCGSDGMCDQPERTCVGFPGDVPLCVEPCDPTASACEDGQGCFLLGSRFICQDPLDPPVALGEPCEGPTACEPGLLCAYDIELQCGAEAGQGCCAPVCDVTDEEPCGVGAVCDPWFRFAPPPELSHVGVCIGASG
ncbi:MAG: hypothetical protein AAF799_24610 [Myxococcota bacterium]